MYVKTNTPSMVKRGNSPQNEKEITKRTTPPNNCDIPVIHKGEHFCDDFLLITFDITVQTDAPRIRKSPYEKLILLEEKLIAMIPPNPTTAPITLYALNLSYLKNRNAKQI